MKRIKTSDALPVRSREYGVMLNRIMGLINDARRASARTVNSIMTTTYWLIGRRIVEFELSGKKRADYGEELLLRMATDLTRRFGRGFSRQNLSRRGSFIRLSLQFARQCLANLHSPKKARQRLANRLALNQFFRQR